MCWSTNIYWIQNRHLYSEWREKEWLPIMFLYIWMKISNGFHNNHRSFNKLMMRIINFLFLFFFSLHSICNITSCQYTINLLYMKRQNVRWMNEWVSGCVNVYIENQFNYKHPMLYIVILIDALNWVSINIWLLLKYNEFSNGKKNRIEFYFLKKKIYFLFLPHTTHHNSVIEINNNVWMLTWHK